jgi:hypothetical protein
MQESDLRNPFRVTRARRIANAAFLARKEYALTPVLPKLFGD